MWVSQRMDSKWSRGDKLRPSSPIPLPLPLRCQVQIDTHALGGLRNASSSLNYILGSVKFFSSPKPVFPNLYVVAECYQILGRYVSLPRTIPTVFLFTKTHFSNFKARMVNLICILFINLYSKK